MTGFELGFGAETFQFRRLLSEDNRTRTKGLHQHLLTFARRDQFGDIAHRAVDGILFIPAEAPREPNVISAFVAEAGAPVPRELRLLDA